MLFKWCKQFQEIAPEDILELKMWGFFWFKYSETCNVRYPLWQDSLYCQDKIRLFAKHDYVYLYLQWQDTCHLRTSFHGYKVVLI